MNKIFHTTFAWTLRVLAVLLVLVALTGSAARWFIYDIEQYRETIVSQISKTLKLDASIDEIDGRVDFLNPIIYAKQVKLSNPESKTPPLLVEQMEIVIDLLSSVLSAEPRIQTIRMVGIEITISTDLENRLLHLPQIDKKWLFPKAKFDLGQLLNKATAVDYFDLGFHDVLIHWDNKNIKDNQNFHIEHFIISPQYKQTQLSLSAELPQSLGQKLTVISTLEHDLSNPESDFYIKTEDLNLAKLYQLIGAQAVHKGRLQSELWGHASYQQGIENLTGRISLKDYSNLELNPDNAIMHFESNLNWQAQIDNRELGLANLSMQSDIATIQNANLAIIQSRDESNYFSNLRLRADYLSPTLYNQLLSYVQSDFSIEQEHTYTSNGEQVIDLILQTTHSDSWFVSPHRWPPVQVLQSRPSVELPQLLGGQLELALNNTRIKHQQWYTPQNLERIELKGNYQRSAEYEAWNIEHLNIKGSDSNLAGNISYSISNNKDKHLKSSIKLDNLKVSEIPRWLPEQTLNPKLDSWLRNALHSGTIQQAELSVDGNPDTPFAKDAGTWRLHGRAEDLHLSYRLKDPDLTELNLDLLLENQHLKIHSDHLRLMDFYAKDTTVELEDIASPYMKINSQGRGPLTDILSYVTSTGLVAPDSALISNVTADGDVDMNLKVHTRLSPSVERETYVGGYIDLNGSNLKLKTLDLSLEQLEGRLHFDRLGGRSDDIKALLNGTYPLTATAQAETGVTRLNMESKIPFPIDYLQTLPLPKNTFATASDTWYADLLIPPLHTDSQNILELKLNSDLKSLAVNLPAPLYKPAGETVNSTLHINTTKAGSDYQFDYGNRMRMLLQIPKAGVMSSSVHFSPQITYPYATNSNGQFTIRGLIPYLSVDEWLSWLENYQDAEAQTVPNIQNIDVLIGKLVWNVSTANLVHLLIKRQPNKTLVAFDSQEIKGDVSIPTDPNARVYIDLEHLKLASSPSSSGSHKLDPNTLPPVSVKIDQLEIGDIDMENFKIALSPSDNGIRTMKMNVNKKDNDKIIIQAQLSGDWKNTTDQNYSNFKLLLNSNDYGQLLRDWNFYSGLKGGHGEISGQLQWDGSPLDFELDQLQGPVKLQIKDGTIEAIEPGVSRLFGLLNINALARRLKLDFKDVFDKGYDFDTMQGTLKFDKADLITQNLDINGPTLDMKISGRTGITQRDYDQKIIVTPHVGSNITLATAFLGGPLTAATVFLLSQVTKLDEWVDKMITLEYTLKGSWDKPEVEFISAPVPQKSHKDN